MAIFLYRLGTIATAVLFLLGIMCFFTSLNFMAIIAGITVSGSISCLGYALYNED